MHTTEILSDILTKLEDSVDFGDWELVKEAIEDLNILYEDLLGEYSDINGFDEEYD